MSSAAGLTPRRYTHSANSHTVDPLLSANLLSLNFSRRRDIIRGSSNSWRGVDPLQRPPGRPHEATGVVSDAGLGALVTTRASRTREAARPNCSAPPITFVTANVKQYRRWTSLRSRTALRRTSFFRATPANCCGTVRTVPDPSIRLLDNSLGPTRPRRVARETCAVRVAQTYRARPGQHFVMCLHLSHEVSHYRLGRWSHDADRHESYSVT